MYNGSSDEHAEARSIEANIEVPRAVNLGLQSDDPRLQIPIQNRENHNGQRGKDQIVCRLVTVVEERLCAESIEEAEPVEGQRKRNILVNEVGDHCSDPVFYKGSQLRRVVVQIVGAIARDASIDFFQMSDKNHGLPVITRYAHGIPA